MLAGIAVLIVWIPRQIGHVVDGLAAAPPARHALLVELGWLLAAGPGRLFLRVGWRLKLYAAAYRLGVELRERLYAHPGAAGRLVLPAAAAPAT
jgi:ATP-binding cassette subfamily B multidrug efflux pump